MLSVIQVFPANMISELHSQFLLNDHSYTGGWFLIMGGAMVESLDKKTKVVGYLKGIPVMDGQMVMLKIRGVDIVSVAGRDLIFEDGSWKYDDFGEMIGL